MGAISYKRSYPSSCTRQYDRAKMSTCVLFLIFFVSLVPRVSAFYIDCDVIQQSGHCECNRLGEYLIDCPRDHSVYPIQLQLQSIGTNEAFLQVTCNSRNGLPQFQWELVEGVDLSKDRISATIVKLTLRRCPASTDTLKSFLNHVNISSSQIIRFTHRESQIKTIANDYLSQFPNLETLNLSENKLLEQLPDLSQLPNLEELNVRSSLIKELQPNAFSSNKKLKKVHLPYNKIQVIPPNIFPTSVESIDISSQGQLKNISRGSFTNLPNLKFLNLQGASLKDADPHMFDNLTGLTQLFLIQAQFKVFPTLRNLPLLTNLTLDWITVEIEPLELRDLPSLSQIKLATSKLKAMPKIKNAPTLKVVDLRRNLIQKLSASFFSDVPSLTELDLSFNQIPDLVQIRAPNLEKLNLRKNLIKVIPKTTFVHLLRLKDLDLSSNEINKVDYNAFDSQGELERLDLSHNEIANESPFQNVPDDFTGFGAVSSYSFINKCIKLRHINLSYNHLDKIYDDWMNVFLMLQNLDLSYNKIKRINTNDLNFVSQKELKLNLTHNEITSINLEEFWMLEENEGSSLDVFLDGNPVLCDCLAYRVKMIALTKKSHRLHLDNLFCAAPSFLKDVEILSVDDKDFLCQLPPDQCPTEECVCWIRLADTTIVVDCSGHNLQAQTLSTLNLTLNARYGKFKIALDLSENGISSVPQDFVTGLPTQVNLVDLSKNNLQSISFINEMREGISTNFSLAGNPFHCDKCNEFTLIWATQASRIVDSDNITCLQQEDGDNAKALTILDLPQLLDYCSNTIDATGLRILIICVVVFCTMCIVMIIFMIRYSWVIKAYMFSSGMGWCLFWDGDLDDDSQGKVYDAFVSFSHKDEDWVIDELVKRLEDEEGYKLCLHFRDWTPGDWIPDQIVRSVDQSKRTVVILSRNFMESIWSRLEFKAAHAQALTQSSNRVILVLMEDDFKDNEIQDEDLKVYMKTNTYLKRSDPWFWHKLKYALPHNKSANKDEKDNTIQKIQQREQARELDRIRTKLEQVICMDGKDLGRQDNNAMSEPRLAVAV